MIEDSSSSSQWVWKAGRWQSDILAAIVIINDSGNAADPDCSIACMEQVLVMEPLSTNWRDEAAFACLDKSVSGDNHKLKLSMTPWRNILVGGKQPITASLHLSFSSKREGAAKWWGKHMSIQKWIYHYQISQENKNVMEGNKRRITMYKLSCDLHNRSDLPFSFLLKKSDFLSASSSCSRFYIFKILLLFSMFLQFT